MYLLCTVFKPGLLICIEIIVSVSNINVISLHLINNNSILQIIWCFTDSGRDVYGIVGLVQMDKDLLVYTDSRNHCLRKLELHGVEENRTWLSSTFAGSCFEPGDVVGQKEIGRLRQPLECKHYQGHIFVTDNLYKIKQISVNGTITTIYKSLPKNKLMFLEMGNSANEFYVTTNYGVLHIKNGKESWLVQSDSSMIFTEPDAIYFIEPKQIVWLSNDTLLVADTPTHTLKKIDVMLNRTEKICTGM